MTNTSLNADELDLDPWVGRVLAGRYRIVARIGAGGMGVVYRAWDHASEGYAVIKMPRRELIGDPKFLQRFEQEFSALRILSHPVVVPVIDFGNDAGMPFAAMPYLAGGSLKQRRAMLQDGGVAPEEPPTLWRWLPVMAQGLDFVHASGYVHRDVKPDNILFDGPGSPYLSDFGIAKIVLQAEDAAATRGLTGTGFALGTPEYMAPELISGTKADAKVDQYALAVVTYELLAGRKPFDGPTPAAVMIAHATGKAPDLASIRPSLPKETVAAVARGMAKNPMDRFESCVAFAEQVLAKIPQPAAVDKLQLMCPQCSRLLNVKPDWAGKQGNCPRCKTALTINADLRSLWIPGDRSGAATPSDRVTVGQLGGTPSRPLAIAQTTQPVIPPAVPPIMPRMPTPPRQPVGELETLLNVLRQQFGSSMILQGLGAAVLAFALLGVTMSFLGGKKKVAVAAATPTKSTEAVRRPQERQANTAVEREPKKDSAEVAKADAAVENLASTQTTGAEAMPEVKQPQAEEPPVSKEPPPANATLPAAEPEQPLPPDSSLKPSQATQARPVAVDATPTALTPTRVAVPPTKELETATAKIRDAYELEYTEADERQQYDSLIDKVTRVIRGTNDPTRRYALLLEAERLCGRDKDLIRALAFLEQRASAYELDAVEEGVGLITTFAVSRNPADEDLYEQAVEAASIAADKDNFGIAQAAADLASSIAKALDREEQAEAAKMLRKGQRGPAPKAPVPQLKEAAALQAAIHSRAKLFAEYEEAVGRLETAPDDEVANGVVGRYLCFTKNDWEKGLAALKLSTAGPIRDLATRQSEMAVAKGNAEPRHAFELAGEWWSLAESPTAGLTETEVPAIRKFAARTYASIKSTIEDPTDQALAEKRAGDERDFEDRAPPMLSNLLDNADQGTRKRQPAHGTNHPIFAIVPEPRGLSDEIYPLLPTEEELQTLANHLNLETRDFHKAQNGFLERLYQTFGPAKWTPIDAGFIIAVNDAFNVRLGEGGIAVGPRGSVSGSRESACSYLASLWLLASSDERDFVTRARSLPPPILKYMGWSISIGEVKAWLLRNTAKFSSEKDKAQALDYIIGAGFTFRGITEFRQALEAAQAQQ
jgi:serine/threonine protein kinase